MPWTTEQQAAIDTENVNLLVSAAAGSGKTAVLTERIVRLVAAGAGIDQFLVVTFTDAATAEMKQRIAAGLFAAAEREEDAEAAGRLRQEALSVNRANISTLHKFCLYILRRNFHTLGLDPAFRPADELQGAMLFRQAMEEAAATRYEAGDKDFLELLRAIGGEEALFASARQLYDFLMAQPEPFEWLARAQAAYGGDEAAFLAHPALAELLEGLQAEARLQEDALARARALTPPECVKTREILDEDLARVRALRLPKSLYDYRAQVQSMEFGRFAWPRGAFAAEKEAVQALREQAKAAVKAQQALLARPADEEAALMRALAPAIGALCAFVRDTSDGYAALKRGHGVVDFADMEHLALRALEEDEVRSALRARFRYVFVDEYQDSSRIQERLIGAVRRENNLFLVGDVKQSIYRFRQADPGLFLEKLGSYTGKPGAPGAQIHLNTNFRSEPPVIAAVNAVFSRIMTPEAGELLYDDNAALKSPREAGAQSALAGAELWVIDNAEQPPKDAEDAAAEAEPTPEAEAPDPCEEAAPGEDAAMSEEEEREIATKAEAEAMLAAGRIHELMETRLCPDPKTGGLRPLKYSDFAVLLRAHRRAGEVWAATLSRMGIPAYVQLTGGYFDAIEVQVFLNLLRVIDNRQQDIPLLSVLRSPVFGFTVEELISLASSASPDTPWAERVARCAQSPHPLAARAEGVIKNLNDWRHESRLLPLPEFLAWLMDETNYYDCVGALPGGRERQLNLDALLERARAYADGGFPLDLWSFLQFMDRAAATASMGEAQPGAADVVRVLSIHKSKGLEYPVVICADLGQAFNKGDSRADLLPEPELGLGARLTLGHVRRDTLLRRAIVRRRWRQQLAEEMRILYVGMTRARSRLILIGTARDAGALYGAAPDPITPAYCAGAQNALHWLFPVALETDALPLTVLPREQISAPPPAESGAAPAEADGGALYAELSARMDWRYPYPEATRIPTKRSVSELAHAHPVTLRKSPAFVREERPFTPAQRGTFAHTVLKELDLSACPPRDPLPYLASELGRMVQERLLSSPQADAVALPGIAAYLESTLFARLRRSPRVERELEFAANVPAGDLLGEGGNEHVLLQGVIDCCFLEDGGWILLDYKTDALLPGEALQDAAQKHVPQLTLYARALEALSGLPVRERYVVLLSAGEAVRI